jgi:UDP-N-acetylmuramate--alanine ligase
MNLENIKNIHFVGIGGIGMSGIAEILADRGVVVSGCDLKPSAATDLLTSRGIPVAIGHDPAHLQGADLVVVTSAVKGRNLEVESALQRGIPVVKRKEILGELVNRKRAIGVSGTHGKTTTSAMIAVVLEEAGLDPTIIVGGMLRNLATNAKNGSGEFVVVEADEYDRSFHELHPEIAVITNVEADHLEYYGSFEAIIEAFRIFAAGVRQGGVVIGCADDPVVATLLASVAAGVPPAGAAEGGRPHTYTMRHFA